MLYNSSLPEVNGNNEKCGEQYPQLGYPKSTIRRIWIIVASVVLTAVAISIGVGVGIWRIHGNRSRTNRFVRRKDLHSNALTFLVLRAPFQQRRTPTKQLLHNTFSTIPRSQPWPLAAVNVNCTFKIILVSFDKRFVVHQAANGAQALFSSSVQALKVIPHWQSQLF